MNILEAEFVKGFMRMADDGWRQGWHERNGGNLSYRLKSEEVELIREELSPGQWQPIGTAVPKLAGEHFLVTGAGKFFRNITIRPEDSFCIIELDGKGENYRVCWGLVNGGRPTSELPSHLMEHEVKLAAAGGRHRVIYHCHPANIIALTFVLPLTDEVFTRELWEMISECPMVFPSGVGVVPWMVPGGRDIAAATAELMERYDVAIWAHHGMFCSGEDFDLTFGLAHTVEKAAEVLVKVLSMAPNKRQTVQPDDLRRLAQDLKLDLPERFLYEKGELAMDGKTTVKYLQNHIRQKDCRPELLKDYFFKLAEEVGELSRAMRKGLKAADPEEIKGTIDEELWDVIYYAIAIANLYDIDLERVIKVKSAMNESRYPSPVTFEENR